MDWIGELTQKEIESNLEGDLAIIYSLCGEKVLLPIIENLAGMNLYISTKPIRRLQKLYIMKNYNGKNIKELAQKLQVSERFVYNVIKAEGNGGQDDSH